MVLVSEGWYLNWHVILSTWVIPKKHTKKIENHVLQITCKYKILLTWDCKHKPKPSNFHINAESYTLIQELGVDRT